MKVTGFKDTIDWYNANAEQYAITTDDVSAEPLIEYFFSLLPSMPKVLDAGCGAGRDSFTMSQKGGEVVGLDFSKGLIAEAKKRYPHVNFVEGSFLELPFADKTFDGVWAHASLVHKR